MVVPFDATPNMGKKTSQNVDFILSGTLSTLFHRFGDILPFVPGVFRFQVSGFKIQGSGFKEPDDNHIWMSSPESWILNPEGIQDKSINTLIPAL